MVLSVVAQSSKKATDPSHRSSASISITSQASDDSNDYGDIVGDGSREVSASGSVVNSWTHEVRVASGFPRIRELCR